MAGQTHALVFGAAGLLGWATANQLLAGYPASSPFTTVTAVLNRSVAEERLYWSSGTTSGSGSRSLQITSGIDLAQGNGEDLARQLQDKVEGVEGVTHVFYFVFSPYGQDHVQECTLNCNILRRVAAALNIACPGLRSFVYPGGSRGYGIYIPGGIFTPPPPLHESLADTLPEDYARTVAYPWFRQILTEASASSITGRTWTWTEICPDAVVGFTPNGSAFSLALHWAQYLSLYAYKRRTQARGQGQGEVQVPFPGTEAGYRSLYTPVSGAMLGRIAVFAALKGDTCGGKVINLLDRDQPVSASELWPAIAAWFGLKGVGPMNPTGTGSEPRPDDDDMLKPSEYIDKYRHLFAENGRPKALSCGVGAGSKQLDSVGWWLEFDRHFSPQRLRALGFTEQRDPVEGWIEAFELFRRAGIIF